MNKRKFALLFNSNCCLYVIDGLAMLHDGNPPDIQAEGRDEDKESSYQT